MHTIRVKEGKQMVRIYGTMGPSCETQETLEAMLARGLSGLRLNMSHATPEECLGRVKTIRAACDAVQRPCDIVLDLKGPEQRVGWLKKPLCLYPGDELILKSKNRKEELPILCVPPAVADAVEPGDRLLVHDGMVTIEVVEALEPELYTPPVPQPGGEAQAADTRETEDADGLAEGTEDDEPADGTPEVIVRKRFLCRTICGGRISSQQSVKIVNKELDGPILSAIDLSALDIAREMDINGVMLSFVRNAEDVLEAKAALASRDLNVRVFSKIESVTGIAHLDEIIEVSDVIIIARGDLGNAVPLWKLPGVQKRIAARCRQAGKPFMVATQMLQSMTAKAVPYRAELLDIYNAVMDGASYVMVTGETAIGKYPVEVIDYLAKTAAEAEKDMQAALE